MLHKSFNSGKCKTSLRLVISRIKLLKNKRQATVSQLRREISQLLESGQDQTARIRVEHVIREEKTVAAYEFIEVFCELISARLNIIESQKNCPIDLKEAIASVIFASHRCPDVTELSDVRKRLAAKYGKEFVVAAMELRPNCGVSSLMVEKLSAKTPDIETKVRVLTAIATEYGINWEPKSFEEQLKKPEDERLDGPSSFGAVKMGSESTTSEFRVQSSHYNEPAKPPVKEVQRSRYNEPAAKPSEQEVQSPVNYSASSSISEFHVQTSYSSKSATKPPEKGAQRVPVQSSQTATKPPEKEVPSPLAYSEASSVSVSVPTKYQAESRPSEPRYESTQLDGSYLRGTDDSLTSSKQNMEFKDAPSAARAAAESAERANLAARAAAKFASQVTGSRKFGTGLAETSQTAHEASSTSKAERARVQADFMDPGVNTHRTKEASMVPKFSEHPSSEIMHNSFRGKNKAKEDSQGLGSSSNRTKTSSPPSSDFDEPDPTVTVARRSSQKMASKHVTDYGYSSHMMQDDLTRKQGMVSADEEEEVEEHPVRSNSSHHHRVEEHDVRSESSDSYPYPNASNDGVGFFSNHNLSFSNDRVGNNNDKGIRTENVRTRTVSEKTQSFSFKSVGSSLDGDIHSALHNRKNDYHMRDDFESDDGTSEQSDNQQESFSNTAIFDDYGPYDGDYRDVLDSSNDNLVEPELLKSKSSQSSMHQDLWFHKDHRREPPIERHVNSDIFSMKTSQTGIAKDTMEDSSPTYDEVMPPKFDEVLPPKFDEVLPPKFDEIDEHYNSDSENDVMLSYQEESKSTSTSSLLYPGRETSHDHQNRLEDQIDQGLKLNTLSGGLKNKGLVRPPYIRNSPESHPSSKERADDPSNRTGRSSKLISERSLDVKDSTGESTSFSLAFEHSTSDKLSGKHLYGKESYDDGDTEQDIKNSRQYSDFGNSREDQQLPSHFEHSSRDRLSGRDIYSRKTHDGNGMEQGFKNSRQYSGSGSSQEDRQPHSQSEHSSIDRTSRREVYRKKNNDDDDTEQDFQGSRQSDLGSSKGDPQLHSPVGSRRTRPGAQSRRIKGFTLPNTESSSRSSQMDSESLNMSYQPDTETETKLPSSKSYDMRSRWNNKYNSSKQVKDEDAGSSRQVNNLSIEDSSDSSLLAMDRKKETRVTSGPELHIRSYKKIDAEISSPSASSPPVLADTETPSKSDMRKKWNSKYFQPSKELLVPSVQSDDISGDELCASPPTVRSITTGMPESSVGPPSKPDLRERWSSKYSSQPSEKHLVPPVQGNEFSEKDLHGTLSTVQPASKVTPESSYGSPSKSDMRNRWNAKYSSPQPSEKQLEHPVRRNESSNKELHASPLTVQPTTKEISESLDGSSFKSDSERRRKNKYSSSQSSEKNLMPPAQSNEFSSKEIHASASTGQLTTKRIPQSSDGPPFKSDVQTIRNKKYVPPPSEKDVPPVQAKEISEKDLHLSPATVQPVKKGTSQSSDGSSKKEKLESQSSSQPPSAQPAGVRTMPAPGAAEVQNIHHAISPDSKESSLSPQLSVGSPKKPQPHPNMPTDYDSFEARFKALRFNRGKR